MPATNPRVHDNSVHGYTENAPVGIGRRIRIGDFAQLQLIAWHLDPDTVLAPQDVLHLYERNWRHVDCAAMRDDERALVDQLTVEYSAGVLLV